MSSSMKIRLGDLRRIVRDELIREAGRERQDYPGGSKYGAKATDRPASSEEEFVARVGKGEMRRGGPRRERYSEPIQRDIEAAEEYIEDIELDPEMQRQEFFYGVEEPQEDPMYDPEHEEAGDEDLDPREMGWQKAAHEGDY